jgi:hypothetical protein
MKGLGKRSTATTGDDVAAAAAVEPGSLRVGLKVAGERHRAAATAAFNCEFMQGEGKGAAERVASRLSVDVGSQQRYKVRGQSLHYAAALIQQQASANPHDMKPYIYPNDLDIQPQFVQFERTLTNF